MAGFSGGGAGDEAVVFVDSRSDTVCVAGELGGLARSRRRWRTLGRRRCLRSDRWKTRVRGLIGTAAEPGSLAGGVVQGVAGRVASAFRQGAKEIAFRHALCIVETLEAERVGCRDRFVVRPSA